MERLSGRVSRDDIRGSSVFADELSYLIAAAKIMGERGRLAPRYSRAILHVVVHQRHDIGRNLRRDLIVPKRELRRSGVWIRTIDSRVESEGDVVEGNGDGRARIAWGSCPRPPRRSAASS